MVEVTLEFMPQIDTMALSRISALPSSHPEHSTFRPFPVFGFVIRHPDGPIVVDTGIGFGNEMIDALYTHESVSLKGELHRCGIDERNVQLIINSHLHFDHCGQNHTLSAPIAVQQEELDAVATDPFYTVPDWAEIPTERARIFRGDADIADGVRVIHTPGHTPGHQAVVVSGAEGCTVIAAQCLFRAAEWAGPTNTANLHAPDWEAAATDSLNRLRSLRPTQLLLSHDAGITA
jgi:N-acyl homoserine lactone hydrolase